MPTKDWRKVVREAERQGWKVTGLTSGHWKLVPPDRDKPIVHAAGTPSDRRNLDNTIALMRRSGFRWPP